MKPKSPRNIIFKYADHTNLLVPEHTDSQLSVEFEAIQLWAANNKMIINMSKTKELIFRRPNPRLQISVSNPICGIEQVSEVKLLGVYFNSNLKFASHVNYILKQCSQRSFLLKQLRNQGLSKRHLCIVFEAKVS